MSYSQLGSLPKYTRDVYRIVDDQYRAVPLVHNNPVYDVESLRLLGPERQRMLSSCVSKRDTM